MTVLCCAMNAWAAAGVDPKVEPVAFIQSRFATPGHLAFSRDQNADADAVLRPSDSDIGEDLSSGERTKRGDATGLGQRQAASLPFQIGFVQFDFEPKKKGWIDEVFRLRF